MATRMDRHKKNIPEEQLAERGEAQQPQQLQQQAEQQSRYDYQGNQPLPPQKPPKRKKPVKKFLFILLLLCLLLLVYCIYGFQKGYRSAKADTAIPTSEVSDFNGQKSSDGTTNVLLLGSDSRGEDQGRSDTIMIAHFSGFGKSPKLISFMRDCYVSIPGNGSNKINAAYAYGGPELLRQTLKENFNIDVRYYAVVNFQSFPAIVDTLCPQGVEINAEKAINLDGIDLQQGPQRMSGIQLLQYARFRKDEEGDFGRVRRQQQAMNAVLTQAFSIGSLPHMPEAAGQAVGYTTTNIPPTFYPKIASSFILGSSDGAAKLVIPVENSWSYGSYADAGSVLEIDNAANQQAIQNFLQ